jgi:ferrochelatase
MVDGIVKRNKYLVLVTTYGEVEPVTIRGLWPSSRKILETVTRQIAKIPPALMYMVADYRSLKHYVDWKLHGYHSSLNAINHAQAQLIASALAKHDAEVLKTCRVDVQDANYFQPPYFEEVVRKAHGEYDGIIVVPMFPIESAFSCGIGCQMAIDEYGASIFHHVAILSGLWSDPHLHQLYATYLYERLSVEPNFPRQGKLGLLLVVHGTLVRDRKGRPPSVFTGLEATMQFFQAMKQVMQQHPDCMFADVRQGCLNHSRGGEWTSDTIEKALESFKRDGYDGVVMFPYGFFADNSETDYDAYNRLKRAAFPYSLYVPCVNEYPPFAEWIAKRVLQRLQALHNMQEAQIL